MTPNRPEAGKMQMTDDTIKLLWQKANGSKPDGVLLHMVRDYTAELLSASKPAAIDGQEAVSLCSCSKTEGEVCHICHPSDLINQMSHYANANRNRRDAADATDDEIRAPDVIRGEDGSPEPDPDLEGSWHLVGPTGRKYALTPDDMHRIFKPDQATCYERAEFEAAWSKVYDTGDFLLRHHTLTDQYANHDTQRAWEGWKLARAASPQPVAQTERALTDEQREAIEYGADCIHEKWGETMKAEATLRALLTAAQPASGEKS